MNVSELFDVCWESSDSSLGITFNPTFDIENDVIVVEVKVYGKTKYTNSVPMDDNGIHKMRVFVGGIKTILTLEDELNSYYKKVGTTITTDSFGHWGDL